ncbi:thioesterase family protein [Gordonia sp. X0973]|uniref:thioesterase family protein n=1 Tax=Gordonia sp. X0973 TaxID=2742602 RepID=UPI000F528B3E|nr:thioesterase family protein [Gordonia sp. X0973]QKT08420.1 thioesterase family protein [Gordonia sp. X0973]
MSPFDDVLALTVAARADRELTYRATIDPVFTIGPKVHGGSAQMMIVNAAHAAYCQWAGLDAPPLRMADGTTPVPVAVTSTYLSAPAPADVELVARLVKQGRTVSVVDVDLVQEGAAMITSSVVFGMLDSGEPRDQASHPLREMPPAPPADAFHLEGSPMTAVMHMHPVVEFALDPTTFPAASGGKGAPTIRGWVRPKDGAADLPFVTMMCDISPPVVMNLGLFGWAPTVTLSTYLRRIPAQPDGGWLRFENSSVEVGAGMFESDHTVLDAAGMVVGQSRQLALIPAKPVDGPQTPPSD